MLLGLQRLDDNVLVLVIRRATAVVTSARRLSSSRPFVDRRSETGLPCRRSTGVEQSAVGRPSYTVIARLPTTAQDISVQPLLT